MRFIAVLTALSLPIAVLAQEWEDRQNFGPASAPVLRILSSTDTSFFAPIIDSYIEAAPNTAVEYLVTGTADLDHVFRDAPQQFDVVISSAMDLQLKLANDGYATQLRDMNHPKWAQWHDSLFAFTSEPAAIVVNRKALGTLPLPRSRQDMIQLMRDHPAHFNGRVGTYDVRQSGLGYLFATQDARASETFWRLSEVMGRVGAQLYCCSGQMIGDLQAGKLVMAYNVLGSYAQTQAEGSEQLVVVLPSEFPTTMMRTVLVSAKTQNAQQAEGFVRHLLALQAAGDPGSFPLPPLEDAGNTQSRRTIPLDPALMTYLDAMKRAAFIREWEDAIVQQD